MREKKRIGVVEPLVAKFMVASSTFEPIEYDIFSGCAFEGIVFRTWILDFNGWSAYEYHEILINFIQSRILKYDLNFN